MSAGAGQAVLSVSQEVTLSELIVEQHANAWVQSFSQFVQDERRRAPEALEQV
jgi:hypothetical protein